MWKPLLPEQVVTYVMRSGPRRIIDKKPAAISYLANYAQVRNGGNTGCSNFLSS